MKHLFLIILLFYCTPKTSMGQLTLTVQIEGLRNAKGFVLLELSNENEIRVMGINKNIENNNCVIVIENLKAGKYAFKFFHDENKNEKLDVNWLGIPKEGFGFSNSPSIIFGPPSFEKTVFELKETISIKCKLIYL